MSVALRQPMTHDEFFRWAEAQDGRYEFDGERPVATTVGTPDHSAIVINVLSELRAKLRGRTCRAFSAEGAGVATIGATVRYPDAVVTCSPVQGTERLLPDPIVVFEVVSPGNARTDRFTKVHEYQAVPSIRRYVLIEQSTPVVVSYSRHHDEPWSATSLSLGDTLALPEIDLELPVTDLYDGLTFDPAPDPEAS